MNLHRSVVLIIASTTLVLTGLAHLISSRLIQDSYATLEQTAVLENVERVLATLQDDVDKLDSFVLDWASWDDTYRFIADHNPAYVKSNLPDGTFRDQKLALIAYFEKDGRMAWGRCFDIHADAQVHFFSGLLAQLTPGTPLLHHASEESRKAGIIMLDQGPMLVASRPILNSESQGPVRGALVMGRMLDTAEISALARKTRLDLSLRPLRSPDLTAGEADALARLRNGAGPLALPRDEGLIEGHALAPDINGRPVLLLTVRMPRDIFAAGRRTALFNLATILVISAALGLAMVLLLERMVVWPISGLGAQVSLIGRRRAFSERVTATGQAELDRLALDINAMLGELEDSQHGLESQVQERTRELTCSNLSLQAEVAERRQAEESLQQARDEAVAANRAKSEFLANMSHEIRTPLGVILSNAEVMQDAGLSGSHRRWLENIRHATGALQVLIDDILDLSKIEAGRLDIRPEPFDLHDCLKRSLRLFETPAGDKGLQLALEIAPDLPRQAVGAADRLGQVLRNLVGNAIKFTERGGVSLHARLAPELPGGAGAEILVRDTGIGIAAEDMGRLFETFTQIDGSYAKRHPGSGLGLAICRRLVQLLGGDIRAESAPGRGSLFSFRIPLAFPGPAGPEPPAPQPPHRPGQPRLDILVAAGNPHEREHLRRTLERAGHQVAAAGVDERVLETLARGGFDLVLLDVQDPGGQGREILRRIRAGNSGLPVVALAPYRFGNDPAPASGEEAGSLLSTPVEPDELFRTVARVLGARGRAGQAAPPPVLDPDALRLRYAGKEDFLSRLAALAALDAPDRLAALRLALERGDLDAAGDQARRLAAPLGLLSAGRPLALALAQELARAAAAGDAREASATLGRLEREAAALLEVLAAQFPAPPPGADA